MTDLVDALNARGRGTMIEAVGMRFVEVTDDHVVAELTFRPAVQQPTGVFHAGALLTLADTAATAACVQAVNPTGGLDPARFPLTAQLSANLIRNANEGTVTAEARLVHRGRTTLVAQTEVRDQQGRLLALVTTTHLVLSGA
jgi:1,4-dihydroxy-2-naphthoyl-CoA hydrolase